MAHSTWIMEEPVIIVKLIVFFHRSVSPQTRRRQCNVNNGGSLVRHVCFAVVGVGWVGGGVGVVWGGSVGFGAVKLQRTNQQKKLK